MTETSSHMRLADLTVDMTAAYEATVSAETVSEYASLTGDHNPIHESDEYASGTRFGQPIAHGLLVASYVQTALTKLVSPGGVSTGYQFKLLAPVFVGSRVEARATCTAVDLDRRRATFSITVTTPPEAHVAVMGTATVAFPREREQA